ncbi:MAG: hypothetical protein ACSLEW_05375 [Nocardioides sp.]
MSEFLSGSVVVESSTPQRSWRPVLIQVGVIVAAFVAAGVVSGLFWSVGWDAPTGTVTDGAWVPDDFEGFLRSTFDGSGRMVLWTGGFGLVIGLVCAVWLTASELATLMAVTVGSSLMAVIAREVARAGQPDSPTTLASAAPDGTVLSAPLTIADWKGWDSWVPMAAGPLAALAVLVIVFLLIARRDGEGASTL